jgi:uncharacterized protein
MLLKFRIKDIPPEGKDREITLEPAWFETTMAGIEGDWARASGEVPLRLSRQGGDEVLARGTIRARFDVPCARCLEPAVVTIDAAFATTFVPAGTEGGEAEDDPDILTYVGDEIDIGGLLREQIVLGIPISALCRPDCKGLCPQCGKDLNEGPCDCSAPTDPRWAALNKLHS